MKSLAYVTVVVLTLNAYRESARCGLVTWEFAGELTAIGDTDGSLGDLFAVGMPFSGQYTFDPNTSDSNPNADLGEYFGATLSGSGNIGDIPFTNITGGILVQNDPFGQIGDAYNIFARATVLGENTDLFLGLGDSSGVVFSDASLPLRPPNFSAFDSSTFMIEFMPDGDALFGELTSLTPEPGTLSSLALGGIALLRRRRP